MSAPTIQSILNCFHKHPHISNVGGYVMTYMVPGGVRDLNEGLGFRRAIAFIDDSNPVTNYQVLIQLNAAITYFQKPLDSHDPEWKVTGLRDDKEVYYYPRCPKGFPLEKMHHLIFEKNEEKRKKFDELMEKHENWFEILETGLVSKDEKEALFFETSAKSHGINGDFLLAWLKLQRQSTKTVDISQEDPKNESQPPEKEIQFVIDPVLYGIKAHDLIIQHMPFVRGNRRLARLILCHSLTKSSVYAPMFWSGPSYEAKVTKFKWRDLKALKEEQDEANKKKIQALMDVESKDFLSFVCALSVEAESVYQRTLPAGERPLERWEGYAWRKDIKAGILQYVKTRGRVLVPDVFSAISVFTDPRGKDTLWVDTKCWYWWECSKEFKEAVESLVKEDLLEWTHADRAEYESIRNVPTFGGEHEVATWKAAALKAKA